MVATTSHSAPLVTVIGATGQQGGSVITNLLESDKEYRLRAITRDPSKPNAQSLEKQGVEVVKGVVSVDGAAELAKTFEGSAYVFGVTNFWEHFNKEREIAEGKALVDAVKKAGATFLWSGLESYAAISKGKWTAVDHYEGKHTITQYAKEQGVPTIVIQPGWFLPNFVKGGQIQKTPNGLTFFSTLDNAVEPFLAVKEDYGLFVRAAIEGGYRDGDELLTSSEDVPFNDAIKTISEVIGKPIAIVDVSNDQFKDTMKKVFSFLPNPDHMAEEMLGMNKTQVEFGYYGNKSTAASKKLLARRPLTIREWAEKQDWSALTS